ncbi:MAG: FAD:protein FMN transferase [Deltaproteobacteria bacterium]|nr:FAD:protein FMN transferase [Deltaproteobacteria bacterium]
MFKNTIENQEKWNIDRRSFLKISGLLGLGLTSFGILPPVAEAVKFNKETYKVSKTRLAMGTFVNMTLICSSRAKGEEAIGHAFEEIDRLTLLMNRFDSSTAIAQLNKEGFLADLHPDISNVVGGSLQFYRLSRGSFDISVKPVVDLFRENFHSGKFIPPAQRRLEEAIALVGSDKIELKNNMIRLKKPGMGITLDGIAKGYIVDRASEVLSSHGIKNHLVNAGGDIRAMGSGKDRKPWTIAIQDPQKKANYPGIIHLTDGAIATSGNYEVYFDREKMFHHIVNPETGLSANLNTSVSVLAKTTMAADALSTSLFVMDPPGSTRLINSLPETECLVVSKEGKKFRSAGWNKAGIE